MNLPILYVDDDPSNLVILEAALDGILPVLTVGSGPAALELMRSQEISVLLTDQRMPGMSGVDLAEAVKDEFPETIRMMITAYSDINAAIEAINRGQVHLYLRKPWDAREIRLSLEMARERYMVGRRLQEMERRLITSERVYSLGVIAAGLAHEIRNPLSALQTNLQLVAGCLEQVEAKLAAKGDDVLASALAELKEPLLDCEQASAAILEITRSVELTSRSEDRDLIDLGEVVSLAVRSLRPQLMRTAELDLQIPSLPMVRGSRTRLGQVILNLMLNSLEAMDPGRRRENRIWIRTSSAADELRLEIEDNGPGIPSDHLNRIFDPFFTTKSNGGTGLGLAITKRIVEEHGGSLQVRSETGSGSCFTITLPAQ